MAWNFMQLEVTPEGGTPLIGPGGLTREEAHTEIQALLDRCVAEYQRAQVIADAWRAGAPDDTVFLGPFTWTIYEYEFTPESGANEWLLDFQKRGQTGQS